MPFLRLFSASSSRFDVDRQHLIHHDVVAVMGDRGEELIREAYTHLVAVRGEEGKEPVIIALASSQPMALAVEGHSGDDGQVNLVVVVEGVARGFHDAEGTVRQTVLTLIAV